MQTEAVIANKLGLHLRAAAVFIKLANSFVCDIQIEKDGQSANGKSIMGLMSLAASPGTKLIIKCTGSDESAACEKLRKLVEEKFGEKE